MATGDEPNLNPFQLLPSDIKGIEDADKYARVRENELNELTKKIEKMGLVKTFWDSKVARKDKGVFNVSLARSNPEDIKEEIEKYLQFYENMINAVDKVNDDNKTYFEKENPYLVIIDLNEELTDLFEIAQSGLETTTSKIISKLHKKFLSKQSELENKLKKMECVFLKQQFLAESEKREECRSGVKKIADGGVAYKEEALSDVTEEVKYLRKCNDMLMKHIISIEKRFDEMSKEKKNSESD